MSNHDYDQFMRERLGRSQNLLPSYQEYDQWSQQRTKRNVVRFGRNMVIGWVIGSLVGVLVLVAIMSSNGGFTGW